MFKYSLYIKSFNKQRDILEKQYQIKSKAQAKARNLLKKGIIKKKVCEVCKSEKSEMHHDDHSKPEIVRFLCRKHHVEHHKNNRKILKVNTAHKRWFFNKSIMIHDNDLKKYETYLKSKKLSLQEDIENYIESVIN